MHRIRHWLHWQPVSLVSEWREQWLWVGFKCGICGEVTGWHRTDMSRRRAASDVLQNQ